MENDKNIPGHQPEGIKAMILCAGLGTRLKPWTDHHPKALAIVNGKSLLQRNVEFLQYFGIREVVINVHHFADQVIKAIHEHEGWGSNITLSHEPDEPLETGGGLLKASASLQDCKAFVMMNVDILTDLDISKMLEMHLSKNPLATLAITNRKTSRYFLFDKENKLCGWKNELTGEIKSDGQLSGNETAGAFSGIHIINPSIFSLIRFKGKFSIVDVYMDLMKTSTILSFDHSESKFIDVGKPDSIEKANAMFE